MVEKELAQALAALVILSFFVERGLATIFQWRRWEASLTARQLKVPITVGVSLLLCLHLGFNALQPVEKLIDDIGTSTAEADRNAVNRDDGSDGSGDDAASVGEGPNGIDENDSNILNFLTENTGNFIGILITALVLAGGSAGALKLMQDILGMTKKNRDLARAAQAAEFEARTAEAHERKGRADASLARAQSEIAVAANVARRSNLQVAADEAALAGRSFANRGRSASADSDPSEIAAFLQMRAMSASLKERVAASYAAVRVMKLENETRSAGDATT